MFVRATAAVALLAGLVVATPAESRAWCNSGCQVQAPCATTAGGYAGQWGYTSQQYAPAASYQASYTADWNAAPAYYGQSDANSGYYATSPYTRSDSYDHRHAAPHARASHDAVRTHAVSTYEYQAAYAPQNVQYNGNFSAQNYGFDGASGSTTVQYGNNFNSSANWNYQGSGAPSGSFQGSAGFGGFNGGLAF